MNEVRISGRLLSAHEKLDGVLTMKVSCMHDHIQGKENMRCESLFSVVMADTAKAKKVDITIGSNVLITGYLKIDHRLSATGQERQKLTIYATEVEELPNRNFWTFGQ